MRKSLVVLALLLIGAAPSATSQLAPIFDGHNDFAIHYATGDNPWLLDRHDLANLSGQGDLVRWQAGGIGGMLATVGSGLESDAAEHFPQLLKSLDWLDSVGCKYSERVTLARSPADVRQAWLTGRLALVAALEGADQLDGNISNLAKLQARGLRSLLIVYDHNNLYGDGAQAFAGSAGRPAHGGLSEAGKALIAEANRLGVIVDLSHAGEATALEAIEASRAPVIFSHSAARKLADTPRNLSDPILRRVKENGGIVMVPLVPYLTTTAHWRWYNSGEREYARLVVAHGKKSPLVDLGMAEWDRDNPQPKVGVSDVVDQVEYVARIVGRDHVGIGTDFDGMGQFGITELSDASKVQALFEELRRRGWTQQQLDGLASGNFLRVWQKVLDASQPQATPSASSA